jgi:hypothetical protein
LIDFSSEKGSSEGRKPTRKDLLTDDEERFLQPYYIEETSTSIPSSKKDQSKPSTDTDSNWKYGPAAYWFNSSGNQKTKDFEYGFKKRGQQQPEQDVQQDNFSISIRLEECHIKDESYLLVNTINWEDKIIYDNQQHQQQPTESINAERIKYTGWIPSQEHRTLASFQSKVYGKNVDFLNKSGDGLCFLIEPRPFRRSQRRFQKKTTFTRCFRKPYCLDFEETARDSFFESPCFWAYLI